jgi:hypothetical protein
METLCNKCGIASRRCQRTGRHFVPVYSADPSSVEEGANRPPPRGATPPATPEDAGGYAPVPCVPSLERLSSPTSSASYQCPCAPSPECRILPSFSTLASTCLFPFENIPHDVEAERRQQTSIPCFIGVSKR